MAFELGRGETIALERMVVIDLTKLVQILVGGPIGSKDKVTITHYAGWEGQAHAYAIEVGISCDAATKY